MKTNKPIEALRNQLHKLVVARIVKGKAEGTEERYAETVAEIARRTKQTPKVVRTKARRYARAHSKDVH
jgi:hypothetical protein